jgi:hypothetical protein
MKQRIIVLAVISLLLAFGAAALAQTSAGFNLEWHVIGGGGNESSSVDYRVYGTIGQSMASPPTASSAEFVVNSGYWFGGPIAGTTIYLPAIFNSNVFFGLDYEEHEERKE